MSKYTYLPPCDVTLALEDGPPIQAHRLILSSSSIFFRTVLKLAEGHPNPFIYLKGVNSLDLDCILDFIYSFETKVPHDQLSNFLKVAKDFCVLVLEDEQEGYNITTKLDAIDKDIKEFVFIDDSKETVQDDKFTNQTVIMKYTEEANTDVIENAHKYEGSHEDKYDMAFHNNSTNLPEYKEQSAEYFINMLTLMCIKNKEEWSCTECTSSFELKKDIMEHVENHVKGLQYPCNICGKVFITLKNIRSHIQNTHNEQKMVQKEASDFISSLYLDSSTTQCKFCNWKPKRRQYQRMTHHFLNRHKGTAEETKLRLMTQEKIYKERLGKDYSKKAESVDTLFNDMVQKASEDQWQCNVCGNIEGDRKRIEKHADTHLKAKDPSLGLFACYECDEHYNTRGELGVHWTLQHSSVLSDV